MTKSIGQLLSALLIVASAFSNLAFAATPFDSDQEFVSAFNWLKTNGYTSMSTTDAFRPADTLTRQEAARFIAKFGEQVLCRQAVNTNTTFSDSNLFDSTLAPFIMESAQIGMLKGSNGMFYPLANFTKAQLIAALTRGIKGSMDETVTPWYANYHAFALASGITVETDVNAIDRPITRYEAALMFYRGRNFQVNCSGTNVLPALTGSTGTITTSTGALSVVKAADLPDVLYVPGTGSNTRVLKLDLLAKQDTTVNSMTFKLAGLVNRNNIQVAVTDENGTRLSTDFRTFNSDSVSLIGLGSSVMLKANQKRTVYVVIQTSNSINERFTISLDSATSVNAGNVSVGGSFPIVSSVVNTTQYSSTSINVRGQYTVASTNYNKLYVGETNKQIARFYVEATTQGTNKDITVKAITLKSSKNLQGILNNFVLKTSDGTVVSTAANLNGKFVTFVMSDYAIKAGQSKTFQVYADVVGGESTDLFYTMIENNGDVVAFEAQTNAALQINRIDQYMDAFQIAEGKNFISRTDNINLMNIPTYEQNIRGFVGNIYTTSDIKVDKVRVYVTNTGATTCTSAADADAVNANVERAKLYINNSLIDEDSLVEYDSTVGKCVYSFSFYGNLVKGNNPVELRFDTQRTAVNGTQLRFSMDNAAIASPAGNAEYVATSNSVPVADINGTIPGGTLIIKNSGLDNIAITNPTSLQKQIVESTNFSAIQFGARANNVRDLKVNSFKLDITMLSGGVNNNFITDADLYVDGTRIATEAFSNTTSLTFNSLNVTIPKTTQRTFEVKVRTYNGNWISATGDVKFIASNFDIVDEKGYQIPSASSIIVTGNLIDVIGGLNVNGQVTSPTSTTIIPATSTASGVRVGTFQMKTDYDTAQVQELAIVNYAGSATSTACTSAVSCTDLDSTSDGLTVEVSREGTVLGNAQLLNGVAYITLNSGVVINSSSNTSFDVTVRGGNRLIDGSNTNLRVKLGVLQPGKILGLSNGASAQTLVTSTTNVVGITSNYTSSVFNPHYVRATTLTFADQAGPAGTNTLLGVHGQNGVTLFKTSITADSSKSANLYKLVFNHSTNGVTVSNYKLRIGGSEIASGDVVCTYASAQVTCTFAGTYANGYPLSAGQSTYVELLGNITTSTTTSDYVTTSMSEGSASDFSKTTATAANSAATVVWSDNADSSLTAASSDWFTDAGVEKLPTNAWTYSRQ